MGKVSLADKMRIQTLREQHLAKAIMAAYTVKGRALSTVKKICQRVDRTGSATERKAGCGRSKSVRSEANIAAVEELICLQEGETGQHSSSREIAAKLNITDISVRRIAKQDLHITAFCRVPAQVINDATKEAIAACNGFASSGQSS